MLRILIADDHAVVRYGVKAILVEEFPSAHFGEARNADEVFQQVWKTHWDLLILDITLPGKSGLEVLKELKSAHPRLPILILTVHPEDEFAKRVLKAGASGYVNKESAGEELVKAAKKAFDGGKYVSQALAEKLAVDLETDSEKQPHERLSDREYEVMCMIASGKTVSQIGAQLSLSVKTISTYRTRLLRKMGMKTNAALTRYAVKNELID